MYPGNTTSNSTTFGQRCDVFLDSLGAKILKTFAWSSLLIIALIGNSVIVAVIYKNRNFRTVINLFILNMAISDLLLPIFLFPVFIQDIYFNPGTMFVDGVFGSIFCKLPPFLSNASLIVSYTTIVLVALESFFDVVYPMERQKIPNKKTCFIFILLTWILGMLYSSQFLYTFRLGHTSNDTPYCKYSWKPLFETREATKTFTKIELLVYYTCFTLVPFVLVVGSYSAIIVSLKRQNFRNHHLGHTENLRRLKEDRRVVLMLICVAATCILTWLPSNLYVFLMVFVWGTPSPCSFRHIRYAMHFFGYIFPAANPIIYFTFNKKYRQGLKESLCWQKAATHTAAIRRQKKEDVESKTYELTHLTSITCEDSDTR